MPSAGSRLLLGPSAWADGDRHMGVASCAGSSCHGATAAFAGSAVSQDEYFTWQRRDRHARAFTTLQSDRSKGIASKLGLADATTAGECLVCHSDAVPAAARASGHRLSDGVGCEACHSGSERWLASHASGFRTDAQRRQSGRSSQNQNP